MKIGILTATRTNNNGTDLQAYAMQELFCAYGAQVELINYACPKLEKSRLNRLPVSVKDIVKFPINGYIEYSHERFRKKYFKRTKTVYTPDHFPQEEYDAIVVGSDQIWNLDSVGGDTTFFLGQVHSATRKYSYAASLGQTSIVLWDETYKLSEMLSAFSGVSVRESSGVNALKEIGIDAHEDLDPLLMLKRDVWDSIIPNKKKRKPFVFVYLVEENPKALQKACEIAKANDMKVYNYTNGIRRIDGITCKHFMSPEVWLWYMKNADYVITNSYHGMAFSVVFHTKTIMFLLENNQQSNTRMKCLAEKLQLDECIWNGTDKAIDWETVECNLDTVRRASFGYVEKIVKGEQ